MHPSTTNWIVKSPDKSIVSHLIFSPVQIDKLCLSIQANPIRLSRGWCRPIEDCYVSLWNSFSFPMQSQGCSKIHPSAWSGISDLLLVSNRQPAVEHLQKFQSSKNEPWDSHRLRAYCTARLPRGYTSAFNTCRDSRWTSSDELPGRITQLRFRSDQWSLLLAVCQLASASN